MTKKFENESFLVEADEEKGCRLNLTIQVKPQSTQKAYKKAIKEVNKQISVPGFRKGHAPDATVISRYSSHIEQEWKDILVNDAYRAALELTQIYPINRESIERPKIERCSKEEGALVKLAYEHYPVTPSVDFKKLSIPHFDKEPVSEQKVQELIEEIRRSNATFDDVSGRVAQEGDFVDVSIESLDEEPPKPIVKDRRFEVSDKRMASWLKKLLLGKSPGDVAEGMSEVDDQADESIRQKFKPTKIRLTVHAIKKIQLPELDDELAKKVGATSVSDLMEKINFNLEKEARDEHRKKQIHALEDALLKAYPFDIPVSLAESEREARIKERIEELKNQDVPDSEIKKHEKQIEAEVAQEVDAALRLHFLNKQIAKQGNISLTNQELNDELVRQMYQYGKDLESEKSQELISKMAQVLLQRKTKEYALEQVLLNK